LSANNTPAVKANQLGESNQTGVAAIIAMANTNLTPSHKKKSAKAACGRPKTRRERLVNAHSIKAEGKHIASDPYQHSAAQRQSRLATPNNRAARETTTACPRSTADGAT
jgi:hypothetical protein